MKLSRLSYGNPKKIGKEKWKANELGFPEVGCHPLTSWVIWRQPNV
jgi:hypothetical protein